MFSESHRAISAGNSASPAARKPRSSSWMRTASHWRTCAPSTLCKRVDDRAVSSKAADLMSKKLKILLAEDDPSLSRYIQTILSRWDCEVLVEQSAEGAIHRAVSFRPDTALLGFVTPGMDGAQAGISLLRVSPETQIVLWNEPVPPPVLDALKAQGYDFRTLPAPFDEEELRAVLLMARKTIR